VYRASGASTVSSNALRSKMYASIHGHIFGRMHNPAIPSSR
jgi:hypothetical protein